MGKAPRLLHNARKLLDVIAAEGALTTTRLADGLGLPRSSVIRLVEGLVAVDLVTIKPNGTVDLSSRWLSLGDAAAAARTEWASARALMAELAERSGCTGVLSIHEGGSSVICLAWEPGRDYEVLQTKPGRAVPMHASSEGRAILSGLGDEERDRFLERAPFEAFTPATMVTADELRGDIARSRRQGHAVSLEERGQGVGSVAVLIREPEAGRLGAVALASISDEILRRAEELARLMKPAIAKAGLAVSF